MEEEEEAVNACNCERGERLRCETERLVRAEVVRAMRLSERRGATHVDGAHMDRAEVAGKKTRAVLARLEVICLLVSVLLYLGVRRSAPFAGPAFVAPDPRGAADETNCARSRRLASQIPMRFLKTNTTKTPAL